MGSSANGHFGRLNFGLLSFWTTTLILGVSSTDILIVFGPVSSYRLSQPPVIRFSQMCIVMYVQGNLVVAVPQYVCMYFFFF